MLPTHALLSNAGLDPEEGCVLAALWDADGATEASLALRAHLPPASVHGLVERLGLLGYVEVEPEPAGVWLTADGFRLRTAAASETARATGRP
ncbi:MAG: helix-turn-helix domain-containing protein [Bacteroidota bacterium]